MLGMITIFVFLLLQPFNASNNLNNFNPLFAGRVEGLSVNDGFFICMNYSNTQEFIKKARKVHGDKYDYSKVIYVKAIKKVIITCPIHGDFTQQPNNHLTGYGCAKCGFSLLLKMRSKGLEKFIKQANKKHDSKYDYSKSKYKNAHTKTTIICPQHNEFKQTPNNHLKGAGCPKCARIKTTAKIIENPNGWGWDDWQKQAEISKHFDYFKLYMIKCWNENECFFKIGRTFSPIEIRFKSLPYNYSVVKVIKGSAKKIYYIEKNLKQEHKHYKYTPQQHFDGYTECYSKIVDNFIFLFDEL